MNIIIVSCDSLRPDFLGCYGHPSAKTPNIDRIASEGVLFEEPRTQYMCTVHSIIAMMTGSNIEVDDKNTLFGILSDRGYKTLNSFYHKPQWGHCKLHHAEFCQESINEWIDENQHENFLMLLWYHQTHSPYGSENHWGSRDSVRPTYFINPISREFLKHQPSIPPESLCQMDMEQKDRRLSQLFKQGNMEPIEKVYIEAIEEVDRQIGEIDQHLRDLNLDEKTIFIVTSDHGQDFNNPVAREAGLNFHYKTRSKDARRVVLIMRQKHYQPAGKRVSTVVRLVDLFPTVIEMLNIDVPEAVGPLSIVGRSLMPVIRGRDTEDRPEPCSIIGTFENADTETRLRNLADDFTVVKLGDLYIRENRLDEAIKHYEEALEINPDNSDAYNGWEYALLQSRNLLSVLGKIYLNKKRYNDAISTYQELLEQREIIEKDPNFKAYVMDTKSRNSAIRATIGECYRLLGDYEKAIDYLKNAIAQDDQHLDLYKSLAFCYIETGELPDARRTLDRVAAVGIADDFVFVKLGDLYIRENRLDEAIKQYEEALEINPDNSNAYNGWGYILLMKGQEEDADLKFSKALELNPNHERAHFNLMKLKFAQGAHQETLEQIDKLVSLEPQSAEIYRESGNICVRLGKYEKAIELYEECIRQDPTDKVTMSNVASCHTAPLDRATNISQIGV